MTSAAAGGPAGGPATGPVPGQGVANRPSPGAAMAVVRAMKRELDRQVSEGTLRSAHPVDANGITLIDGRLDLAMLAFVAEMALLRYFPELAGQRW